MRATSHAATLAAVAGAVLIISADCWGPADTDSDIDPDPDTDTDTDADSDSEPCSNLDAVLAFEVRVTGGAACTDCPASTSLDFAGSLTNPCPDPVVFTTISTCLVGAWTVAEVGGSDQTNGPACGDAITEWTLDPGASVEEPFTWGPLDAGDYDVTARFDDVSITEVTHRISVH